MLIHDFSDNSIRKIKTDRADSLKIANYALTFWQELRDYSVEDETRQMLKIQSRLYERTLNSSVALRNGLISYWIRPSPVQISCSTNSAPRQDTSNGWILCGDFGIKIAWLPRLFLLLQTPSKNGAKEPDTTTLFRMPNGFMVLPRNSVATLAKNDSTKLLITQAVDSLNAVYDTLQILRSEMQRLASLLPEYEIVMGMQGAGPITGPQLMAEIGDVRRFTSKGALVAFAGVDAPPFQSGSFNSKSRHVSKRGSPHLRRVLFTICSVILQHSDPENAVFQFMDKKRAEGKHFYVYTVAGGAKFLRIYYAKVKEYLNTLDSQTGCVA